MKLEKVFEKNSYEYYKYTPSIFRPFYVNLEKITIKRRIRLFMAFLSGYSVYYLVRNGKFIGYCLVQNGKDKRYKFATEKDIIVGPYYIDEAYRGKKLSIDLLNYILKYSNIKFEHAYDYIAKDNLPSIRASESVGFKYMSDANISKFLRKIELCETCGHYNIYKY